MQWHIARFTLQVCALVMPMHDACQLAFWILGIDQRWKVVKLAGAGAASGKGCELLKNNDEERNNVYLQ